MMPPPMPTGDAPPPRLRQRTSDLTSSAPGEVSMPSKILIDLEDALAWARGERHLRVRLPDGSLSEMSLIEYRRVCELKKRLRAHTG